MTQRKTLEFRRTMSRGRDTYGYNICSLWIDGHKVASCNGGGYDMQGTCLGNWIANNFQKELNQLNEEYYGLTFHNPTFDPSQVVIDGKTIEERERAGLSLGLERYQSFYSASSKLPTEQHNIALLNGACGFSSMERIANAIGIKLHYVPTRSQNQTIYIAEYEEQ
ncbi:MAG: hypothetical protein ACFFCW_01900 [Candidatus Hodarchaeota archaeon]